MGSTPTEGRRWHDRVHVEHRRQRHHDREWCSGAAYDLAIIDAKRNVIEGAAKGSGIAVRNAVATLTDDTIGPIGGFNGLWI